MSIIKQTLALMLFSSALLAAAPEVVVFQEGEQFDMPLSRFNFNRVFVEGEKIVQVRYPEGTFVVDKADMGNPGSKEGSVYIKPMFDAPLTVFFTTDEGHHFSLTIKPDESAGKTLRFVTKNTSLAQEWKPSVSTISEIEQAMGSLVSGLTPKGFKSIRTHERPFYVKGNLKLNLVKAYQSEKLSAYVYRVENKAKTTIDLDPTLFPNQHAESIKLSQERLSPGETAYLYGLYDAKA